MLRVNGLQVFVDALLSFYGANELLGLFLFLFIEEAGVPLWFLPGDVLVMLAGSRPGRNYFSGAFLAQQSQMLVASVAANLDEVAELIVFLVLIAIAVGVVIRHRRAACQKGAVRSDATHPV